MFPSGTSGDSCCRVSASIGIGISNRKRSCKAVTSIPRRAVLQWGPDLCFAESHLYTTKWGIEENVDIEKFFFGRVDTNGKSAVEFFSNFQFDHPDQLAASKK